MNIRQTKCDHCGKIQPAPSGLDVLNRVTDILTINLRVEGRDKDLDFCNEDCLRECLIKRKAPNDSGERPR